MSKLQQSMISSCNQQISYKCHLQSRNKVHVKKKNNDSADILTVRKYCQLVCVCVFSHTSQRHFCSKTIKNAIETNGEKSPLKPPIPLGRCGPQSSTPIPRPTPLTPKWHLDLSTHFCTTMTQSPHWLQWDAPHLTPNQFIPFDDDLHPHLIHPSLNRHDPPP